MSGFESLNFWADSIGYYKFAHSMNTLNISQIGITVVVKTKGKNLKILNVNSRKIISFFITFSLFAFFAENSVYAQPKEREYWPTSSWKSSTPEMQGMDSAKFLIAVEFIQNRLPDAYSLLVVKNGYLVFEKYFRYGSPERVATIHSVTKSVMSALIGIALEKGYVKSVDQKLIEFFPEYFTAEMDQRKKEISLKHLLTMSTGFQWDDWGSIVWAWINSRDRLKFTIQLPLRDKPGEVFEYNTSASHLLSGILTKTSKTTTLDFANQHLFEPLGISVPDFANQPFFKALGISVNQWRQDQQGYYIGGYGLKLTARDLAKIGYLYLNNGYWNGRSIVPETWVKESTWQYIYAFDAYGGPHGYGYQWWVKQVDDCNSYYAWGRRGQFIVVIPELDLVIVVTSETALPHPLTSIHYHPLFDIVASSVVRERPPAKILTAVKLPPDVKALLADFNQALSDRDIVKVSDFISDNYLSNGRTKNRVLEILTMGASYVPELKIIITGFELQGNVAKIEGIKKDKYFEISLPPGTLLIRENGQWKLYGNQVPK